MKLLKTTLISKFIICLLLVGISTALSAQRVGINKTKLKSANLAAKGNVSSSSLVSTYSVIPADAGANPLSGIISSLVGGGVTVSNITTNLPATSNIYGSFSGGTDAVGIDAGLLLTTGSVQNSVGPNISQGASQGNGLPGLPSLNAIIPGGVDGAYISFDVTPSSNTLVFKYVFASEEYNDYVGTQFNDVFAFFVSGPGIVGSPNIALLPSTSIPVAINNVNKGRASDVAASNPDFYINNDDRRLPIVPQVPDATRYSQLEYDGLTVVLTATISVIPGSTYNLTFAIQDVSDGSWDSGVFIEGGSIQSKQNQNISLDNPGDQPVGTTVTLSAAASSGLPVSFSLVSGPATLVGDQLTITGVGPIVVQADQGGNNDWFPAPPVTATFSGTQALDPLACSASASPTLIYLGYGPQSATLTGSATGGLAGYTYSWSSGGTNNTENVNPTATATYTLTVTDALNQTTTCSVAVQVKDVRCGKNLDKVSVCHRDMGKPEWKTLCIGADGVAAHLAHGCYLGACNTQPSVSKNAPVPSTDQPLQEINATVSPNPSTSTFKLQIPRTAMGRVSIYVYNEFGKLMETKLNVDNTSFTLGNNYKPGTYYVQIVQGDKKQMVKMIKTL
jgi:hypothetical protein